MDQKPIGVFDSGLGGLTAVRELKRLLPQEDIVYFGDTGRVPYGSRSKETILKYARQDVAFLRTFDLKAILIGTQASIRSGAYEACIARERPGTQVVSQACPLFVPLVENGRFHRGDVVIETIVREYLSPLKEAGVDTLVLGCTHYPLLEEVIGDFMGPEVALINVGAECARAVARRLEADGALARRAAGTRRYFVSDRVEDFARLASIFLQEDVTGEARQIELEQEILNHRLGIRNHAQ